MSDYPNIVLIVFDTARRDRFGCYGYNRGTTPAVDAFAREALLFEGMMAPAPWTVPSHASLFTGLHVREHGADHPVPILPPTTTLASHLRASGYTTVCVTNNPLIHDDTGLSQGFMDFIFRPYLRDHRWLNRARFVLGIRDSGAAATNRVVAGLLPRLRRPFFLFINYLECHWHYTPPRRFERRFVRGLSWAGSVRRRLVTRRQAVWEAMASADSAGIKFYSDLYDAELACLDDRFARLIDMFRKTRLLDETIFIVTSDHGENIGEEGLGSHQGSLRQNLIHVPFLVRIPGRSPTRIGGLVQFTDVFAGLCRQAGLSIPEHLQDRPFSVDPFTLESGDGGRAFAFAEWHHWGTQKTAGLQKRSPHFDFSRIPDGIEAALDGRKKLVVDLAGGRERLYDLTSDDRETHDIAAAQPSEVTRLRSALSQWRDAFPANGNAAYSVEDQVAVEKRLRELGYV